MKHRVGVTNLLFVLWVVAFTFVLPKAVMAQSAFKNDVKGYDVESLAWAILMSVFGGALRTIFTLAADNRVVTSVFREAWKDVIVACVAGTVAYIGVEALRASGALPVPSEVRFAVIVFAGWSRLSFFGWINAMGIRVTEAVTERLTRVVNGGAPAPTPAPTPAPVAKPKPFQEKP